MKKLLAVILWLQLDRELGVHWKGRHGRKGLVHTMFGGRDKIQCNSCGFPGEEQDYWGNQRMPPSEMFSLDRVKWRAESGTKPSVPEHAGGKKPLPSTAIIQPLQTDCIGTGRILGKVWNLCLCCCQMEQWSRRDDEWPHLIPKPVSAPCISQPPCKTSLPPTSVPWTHSASLTPLVCTQTCSWWAHSCCRNYDCEASFTVCAFLSARKILKWVKKDAVLFS